MPILFLLIKKNTDRSTRRNAVSDQVYVLIQSRLIILLTVLNDGETLIQHPGWFNNAHRRC
jgi:hypothetical protein